MSVYESSITNPKKQLEFYKQLSEQLQQENQELKNSINALQKELNEENLQCSKYAIENQELKKQLEEKDILIKQCELSVSNVMDCYCERTDCSGRIKDSKQYDSLVQKVENQQKEFIKYLEDWLKILEKQHNELNEPVRKGFLKVTIDTIKEILSKYKEIIGDDK